MRDRSEKICVKYGTSRNFIVKKVSCFNLNPVCKKIDKNRFVNTETGEIIRSRKNSRKRNGNAVSLRRSKENLSDLIYFNVDRSDTVYRYTLTYAEKEQDLNAVYRNHNYFIEKLRKSTGLRMEYIYTVEPYEDYSGYHIHGIIISKSYIRLAENALDGLWKRGYTSVAICKDHKNLPSYITPHETKADNDFAKHLNGKAVTNGFLPAYCNIVRHSTGIKQPTVEYLTQEEFNQTELSELQPDSERTFCKEIKNKHDKIICRIWYRYSYYTAKESVYATFQRIHRNNEPCIQRNKVRRAA